MSRKYQRRYHVNTMRAAWQNYSAPGAYFIAISTANHEKLLGHIQHGEMHLSAFGEIVQEEWERSFILRKDFACDFLCILPDHLYGIVRILGKVMSHSATAYSEVETHCNASLRQPLQREPHSISTFVGGFKGAATRRINAQRGTPQQKVWQALFYDHVFRSSEEHEFLLKFLRRGPLRSADTVEAIVESYVKTHRKAPSHHATLPPPLFPRTQKLEQISRAVMEQIAPQLAKIEQITEYNQQKVLAAFINHRVSESHFAESTGYGYGDRGRETLEAVLAEIMGADAALMRHTFTCGTHTLAVALFGVLRPGDTMLSLTGAPYDTLQPVIGLKGSGMGSLKDFGVQYEQVDLDENGRLDWEAITHAVKKYNPKLVYLQRSRGYTLRPSLSVDEIAEAAQLVKDIHDCIVMVDNCYGEFVQTQEPTQLGADLIAGSLIKNPGGGVARNGGYIAGRRDLVELCAYRLTTPGLGTEVGATLGQNRNMFMGLFHAPHVVGEALKTAVFAAALFERLGYSVSPHWNEPRCDIIQCLQLRTPERLIAFCQGLQSGAPVDAFVKPEPWNMPGYDSQVIMAAGAFIMGASIELSADAPLREPYAVWLQGGLNFHSAKIGVLLGAQRIYKERKWRFVQFPK